MGTIAIAVDGNHVFNWQGDEAEAKHIIEEFPRGAHHVGMTPDELSDEGIGQLLKDGRFLSESPVVREMQMMGVIWRILEMELTTPNALARSLITSATRTSTSTFKCMVRGLWQPWPPLANLIREMTLPGPPTVRTSSPTRRMAMPSWSRLRTEGLILKAAALICPRPVHAPLDLPDLLPSASCL
jgi:hypothetical protein